MMDTLVQLADLIAAKIRIEAEIAAIIHRPALIGHTGEYIAAQIFDIHLAGSAVEKGIDGRFRSGPLAGRGVNVKWYARHEGLLDITPAFLPDYYLVLAGPPSAAMSSRNSVRPWLIESAFLFDAPALVATLQAQARAPKIGVATSIRRDLWRAAELYPNQIDTRLILTPEQRRQLALFSGRSSREPVAPLSHGRERGRG